MAGNVAEWVADVYRPVVDDEFNDFAYYRGNVYTKNVISEDGTVTVIGIDDIEYDTLSNGKVVARGLPGQLAQVPIEDNDAYLRTNYDTSNNINFRDGDKQSTRYFDDFEDDESAVSTTDKMYDSPKHRIDFDDNGSVDPIISYYIQGKDYPLATRDELLAQLVQLKSVYPSYKSYAETDLEMLLKKIQTNKTKNWKKWVRDDQSVISCTEKIKVMTENFDELKQLAQDAFEDGLLMEVSDQQMRDALHQMIDDLKNQLIKK